MSSNYASAVGCEQARSAHVCDCAHGIRRTGVSRVQPGRQIDVAARNHGSQRRHRGRIRIATGKANVFGFCSGAPPFVPERKTRSRWLAARVVAVGRSTDAGREHQVEMGGQVFGSDVTARDVLAVTSPANRIATAEQSLGALRAAALGGRGQAAAAKSESCIGLPHGKPIRHYRRRLVLFADPRRVQPLKRGELWITLVALRWRRNDSRLFRLSE